MADRTKIITGILCVKIRHQKLEKTRIEHLNILAEKNSQRAQSNDLKNHPAAHFFLLRYTMMLV